jgi:hypothetical protein
MKTRKLTDYQKEFLLEYFFLNEKYAGWKNIASTLIEAGTCIVAGNECIWKGGIGNFIKIEEAKHTVGCVLYIFDLEYFLSSEWYKEISNQYILLLSDKKRNIIQEYEEITNL